MPRIPPSSLIVPTSLSVSLEKLYITVAGLAVSIPSKAALPTTGPAVIVLSSCYTDVRFCVHLKGATSAEKRARFPIVLGVHEFLLNFDNRIHVTVECEVEDVASRNTVMALNELADSLEDERLRVKDIKIKRKSPKSIRGSRGRSLE